MSGASDTHHSCHSSKVGINFRSELIYGMRTGKTTHKVQDLPRPGNRIIPVLVAPKQDTNARHFTGVTLYINCAFVMRCLTIEGRRLGILNAIQF